MTSVVNSWEGRGSAPAPIFNIRSTPIPSKIDALIQKNALESGLERPNGYNVSFHYNSNVEFHHFGRAHPMKPWRLQLTKQLVLSFGLQYTMDLYDTQPATYDELAEFHEEDYLNYLSRYVRIASLMHITRRLLIISVSVTPQNYRQSSGENYNFGDDCPVFDDLFKYCQLYTGSTLSAARNLTSGSSDIAINWSGGLHHAFKAQAAGFCYVNDIVLAILELLRVHARVMYIDIDVHHGDGVELAFASSDRVMTLSYHKYDPQGFFPGTGGLHYTGPDSSRNPGSHHSINVPLNDGIDDEQYTTLFRTVTGSVFESFQPTAIVLQCGADSLGGDRLGRFNLNIKAHGECLSFVKSLKVPLLVLGGGGYTARNVARLWTHETSLCVGAQLNDKIPDFVPYRRAFEGAEYGDGLLYPELANIEGKRHRNEHSDEYLNNIVVTIKEHLRYLKGAPSVAMQHTPRDIWGLREQVDREIEEEAEHERHERRRRTKERGIGIRGELYG